MNDLLRLEQIMKWSRSTISLVRVTGVVSNLNMNHYTVSGLSYFLRLGDFVSLDVNGESQIGEVIRIDKKSVTVKPFGARSDAALGMMVHKSERLTIAPTPDWRGRIIDALCRPIDGLPPLPLGEMEMPIDASPPPSLKRDRVVKPLRTGVRVIDLFTPLCAGQRIGIFAGSGIGKSSLLAMLAKAPDFDIVVIALVGERGREVRDLLEGALGDSRKNVVAVVSTGDESPMMRRLCPTTATCIAEFFRNQGKAVLLVVDSITRFAHASREVHLSAGEPPVARGYAPSVFSDIPRLLERAGPGTNGGGSITAIYAVLVDGDDHNDPVADCIRGTLDGHVVLDRSIADQGRFPAVDISTSISRLAHYAWSPEQGRLVAMLRSMVTRFEETRDLRLIGGYKPGGDQFLDQSVKMVPRIYDAMQQSIASTPSVDAFQELAAALRTEEILPPSGQETNA